MNYQSYAFVLIAVAGARMALAPLSAQSLSWDTVTGDGAAILHDEDGDGKLKRNVIGIPSEGVGMTGKPLGNRAPKFAEAVIEIQGNQNREITLKYW